MVAFNLCESFVNSLIESIQITFLIVLLKTYEYSVPTCTRRNLAPKQTLTKHRVYFLGLFGVCLGSAFRKIRICSGITMDLHEICSQGPFYTKVWSRPVFNLNARKPRPLYILDTHYISKSFFSRVQIELLKVPDVYMYDRGERLKISIMYCVMSPMYMDF